MNRKIIFIVGYFILSFGKTIKAQDSGMPGFFEGLQNTFTETFTDNSKLAEVVRWAMLFNSDIQLYMNGKFDAQMIGKNSALWLRESEVREAIHAKFDWDNKAMSMYLTKSGSRTDLGAGGVTLQGAPHPAGAHYQYTDKHGYWYVPVEPKSGKTIYIKVNAKKGAASLLQGLIDVASELNTEALFLEIEKIRKAINLKQMNQWANMTASITQTRLRELVGKISDLGNSKELREVIKTLLNERYSELVGFPVFIHWAFLYSPELIKSKFEVSEKRYDCNGIPNACTELTVLSGSDKGKSMRFDQYGRLLFINALKEGTALFEYGKDVTVNLPQAYTMEDIRNGKVNFR